jgi:hypothetical protein
MSISQNRNIAYSFNQPLSGIFPDPIVSLRSPLTTDKAQIGTVWVNKTINAAWILTSVVSNSATWTDVSGAAGSFTTLTVTGNANIGTATGADVSLGNDNGATSVTINAGTSGTIALATNTGGEIVISSGDVTSINGDTSVTINSSPVVQIAAGTLVETAVTIGNTTAGSTVALATPTGTPVTTANGLTATVGNITATNGNVVISTAAKFLQLPGPVKIMSGAGAPASGLATEVGDMYINTTAASATTRLYIATAASTWTNVTCAA